MASVTSDDGFLQLVGELHKWVLLITGFGLLPIDEVFPSRSVHHDNIPVSFHSSTDGALPDGCQQWHHIGSDGELVGLDLGRFVFLRALLTFLVGVFVPVIEASFVVPDVFLRLPEHQRMGFRIEGDCPFGGEGRHAKHTELCLLWIQHPCHFLVVKRQFGIVRPYGNVSAFNTSEFVLCHTDGRDEDG